ncbi:MAG: CDP-diacylglycerol--serine O-phosphatidyltransferase [Deltaproteobacteria bacterium]|nr:CDP-diacylglycerol--serine O-phosphatidyltransferase [Deltaproteobacteria bacterium]MBW2419606.1 CDP-diacylglycerol--serine O-phosphatidyltransferase [Deltaproteobacteria bacterium]
MDQDPIVTEGGEPGAPKRGRRRRRRRGRRRERRFPGRGNAAALLPHVLTTVNLAAGFYAIVKASTGDPERASWAILVAGIFDILDGRAARLTQSVSRFGTEYDSISDTVSFGVAPAIIAFHAGHFLELGWTGWVMAFTYTACASLRLARYNVTSGRYRGRFDGLPTPAAAGMTVSTVWFTGFLKGQGIPVDVPAVLPAMGIAALGLLMVSPIPYRTFKDVHVRGNSWAVVIMVVGFTALIAKPSVSFFIVGIVYVFHGPIEWYWHRQTGRSYEKIGPDDAAEAAGPADLERALSEAGTGESPT